MNSVRANGEIVSAIRMKINRKKQCPQADFLLAAPFSVPYFEVSPTYRSWIRTYVTGSDAEWINDNLYEGAHLEVRHGFLKTFKDNDRHTHYFLVANAIDRVGSMQVEPYKPYNIGRFSGTFYKQFYSFPCDNRTGLHKVGVSVAATPDIKWYGTFYNTYLSVICYADLADEVDHKLRYKQPIDYIEGVLQPFHAGKGTPWGIFVVATRFEF